MLLNYKKKIASILAPLLKTEEKEIVELLEIPKQISQGQLSLPVFRWTKAFKRSPQDLASFLAENLNNAKLDTLDTAQPMGGFLNVFLSASSMQMFLLKAYEENVSGKKSWGFSDIGLGKTLLIDFASPNVAKPMHVGHLRATIIGQSLYNIAKTQSYKLIGLNHLGDWGVLFGRLVWAYKQWGTEYDFKEKGFSSLYALYVRFHKEAESNSDMFKEASLIFKQLEAGDKEIVVLWEKFINISLTEYQKVWDRLGVRHDLVKGESFYNDRLKSVEKFLEQASLLEESEGAMVVKLDEQKMPPCLIRKSDGASLYATRDLASAWYRMEELKADINLYVVGQDQNLYFKQLFAVLEKMKKPWAKNCHHINFGMYRFKDAKMSSRKGHVILLEDILDQAYKKVFDKIKLKHSDWNDKKMHSIAEKISVGAVIFNDLSSDRSSDVEFCWDKILNFEGDSGPYVQYVFVRCQSLLRKFVAQNSEELSAVFDKKTLAEYLNKDSLSQIELPLSFVNKFFNKKDVDFKIVPVLSLLLSYDHVLSKAFCNFKPHLIAQYLLQLCSAFNKFYAHHKILSSKDKNFYIIVVYLVQAIIKEGLGVLNIQCPEEM
ncbi:MAG: arginine--tRNA ligase [Bdellovibrionaceae bacterium]|nr:arginine--tRNA ligase [Pseudobdellovibrionaceae bacterium]